MKTNCRTEQTAAGPVRLWRLENASGCWVELSELGAGITGVGVPDSRGEIANVALCYASPESYMGDGPCLGKCPGRYANRIARGNLTVEGRDYALAVNCGPHHLHGGPTGFHNSIWASQALPEGDGVSFTLRSPDGHEGYPGDLDVRIEYRWSDDNRLTLRMEARAGAPTVVNLTNHAYWHLGGATAGSALGHTLRLKASRWVETDPTLAPTGRLADVEGTPMDFRTAKALGRDIEADFDPLHHGKGYDHCFAVDGWQPGMTVCRAAVLADPVSGRTLAIDTDQPGMQLYTGNWLAGSPAGPGGTDYADYDGVAIECQGFPDAPNQPSFPSQSVAPGRPYSRVISYAFGVSGS